MILGDYAANEEIADTLVSVANGSASVPEQSDAWCRFDLEGDRLADVLERVCPINFREFEGGDAVRTSIEHVGCFVLCFSKDRISVLGPRSFAGSLHHALVTAIKSAL